MVYYYINHFNLPSEEPISVMGMAQFEIITEIGSTMSDKLLNHCHTFLQQHCNFEEPVLIALSGGPDSLALLHLLLELQPTTKFGIAHVDHGWRLESGAEAEQLALLAETLNIPFHLLKLDPNRMSGNLEESCRKERLRFFAQLCKTYHYQAVILAHHANDQAETVLKRILEGAALTSLAGLQPVTQMNDLDLVLWRPLLKATKADILQWLDQKKIEAFQDKTNVDPKYLRGRFRTEIIPYLSQSFGKEIENNLCHLAQEVEELQHHFRRKCQLLDIESDRNKERIYINVQSQQNIEPFELKMMLKELFKVYQLPLSRQQLTAIVSLLMENRSNKKFLLGGYQLIIDRRQLFILKAMKQLSQMNMPLQIGCYGNWNINLTPVAKPLEQKSGWKQVWRGRVEISLPAGNYHLAPPNSALVKRWSKQKIPAFLRNAVPVIWEGDLVKHEFLSECSADHGSCDQWLHVTIREI